MWHPEKPVFYVSEIPPDQEYGLVPTSSTDPFYEWCKDPAIFAPLDLSWFPPNGITLLTGSGDLFALAFGFIMQWNQKHPFQPSFKHRPIYFKGDESPASSSFYSLLTQYSNNGISCHMQRRFQSFPLQLFNSPNPIDVAFSWIVVNREIAPWDRRTFNNHFRIKNVFESTEHFPQLVILDGFSWGGNKKDFADMLTFMRDKNISLIVLNPIAPPKSFVNNTFWDNIIIADQWRKWRCAPQNMTLKICKKEKVKVDFKYRMRRDPWGCWSFIPQCKTFLKPFIVEHMKAGKTAVQIVDIINNNELLASILGKKLTVSTLANLKREWGLRTYKPESKPRKAKSKRQKDVVSLFEDTI